MSSIGFLHTFCSYGGLDLLPFWILLSSVLVLLFLIFSIALPAYLLMLHWKWYCFSSAIPRIWIPWTAASALLILYLFLYYSVLPTLPHLPFCFLLLVYNQLASAGSPVLTSILCSYGISASMLKRLSSTERISLCLPHFQYSYWLTAGLSWVCNRLIVG